MKERKKKVEVSLWGIQKGDVVYDDSETCDGISKADSCDHKLHQVNCLYIFNSESSCMQRRLLFCKKKYFKLNFV